MTEPELLVLAAGLYLLVAVVWMIVGHHVGRLLRGFDAPTTHLIGCVAACAAVFYLLDALYVLLPPAMHVRRPPLLVSLYVLSDLCALVAVVVFRHMTRYLPGVEAPPTRRWLAVNYGSALFPLWLDLALPSIPLPTLEQQLLAFRIVFMGYLILMLALSALQVSRFARRGAWGPGTLVIPNRSDVVLLSVSLVAFATSLVLHANGSWQAHPWMLQALDLMSGLMLAVPLAIRVLGQVIQGVLVVATMLGVAAALYAAHLRLIPFVTPELHGLVPLGFIVVVVGLLVPGQMWLWAAIGRLVLHRDQRRRAELHEFLHALSPELGATECCRRALAELARLMRIRGAAILLRDGEAVVQGAIVIDGVQQVWPRGTPADALPRRRFLAVNLPEPAWKEALIQAGIVGVIPILTPRRRHGDLFITTGLIAAITGDEEIRTVEAFADRLGLVLDGAALLARTVAVERALAHREKLAALGELAARVAHEIRNPVTAARSLAQQLQREAGPSPDEPAQLILTELERVERQVAALLRFSRREDFRLEAIDLGDLARTTVDSFASRLHAARVGVDLDLAVGVVAHADREKLRQVLVNLIENALDALSDAREERRLAVGVGTANGTALVQISDNGPGVAPDAMTRLFEPFFSLKPTGTGLGLAIAKRTVDAHGGSIEATCPDGRRGMTFRIALPLVRGSTDAA